jgi:hypothetical protein
MSLLLTIRKRTVVGERSQTVLKLVHNPKVSVHLALFNYEKRMML